MKATRYPIDYETLEKGDSIPIERCESILDIQRGDSLYQLGLLKLAQTIMDAMMEHGRPVQVVQDHGALRVLTDAESSSYQDRRADRALSQMREGVRQLGHCDVSTMSDYEKALHTRRVRVVGGTYLGAKNGRKEAHKLIAYERKTPGLPNINQETKEI